MTVGVCVVGAGFWAREMHIPALQMIDGVEIRSVVAASGESAHRAARDFGIDAYTTQLAEALDDPAVDVVDIVAPPFAHADAVIAAAAAGKHAICIKPLARTGAEAQQMLDAVAAAGTRLFYAENVPFIPALREAKRLVDTGHIGEVFRVKADEGIPAPHSDWFFDPELSGGGAILDMAVHSLEFCRYFAGSEIASVYAEAGTFIWQERTPAEDTAVLTLRFDNGIIGQCEDGWSLAGAMDSRFEIFGTHGRILIDNLHRQPLQVVSDRASSAAPSGWTYPLPIPGLISDGHLAMLQHFIDCLRTGAPSSSDGEVGARVLRVVDAAMDSLRSGRRESIHYTRETSK